MYDFTPRAKQVLRLAEIESGRLDRKDIGTEQLLFGIIYINQGRVYSAMSKQGPVKFTLANGRISPEESEASPTDIPFSPRSKKAIESALEKSRSLEQEYIGPEHIFLGLLGEKEGEAYKVLNESPLDLAKLEKDVIGEIKS